MTSSDALFVVTPPFPHVSLGTPAELATGLGLDLDELEWLADCDHRERRRRPTARHYHYHRVAKSAGGIRLIEAPKPRLKAAQRTVLDTVLGSISPHEAAHGFVRGRSAMTGAALHTDQAIVVRIDLRDFFASIPASRIHALLHTAGYPTAVARLLTGLCTNATPTSVWGLPCPSSSSAALRDRWWRIRSYAVPHLPAGAPTSPALANLAAFRLDCRLSGLAREMGCVYSRYADDLTISGGETLRRNPLSCFDTIVRIVTEEGFRVHPGKTRCMPRGTRQVVTGLVVNAHPNVRREAYDRLRAILYNCVRYGPQSQTQEPLEVFRAHLIGKLHWCATHQQRATRLRALFDRIVWC